MKTRKTWGKISVILQAALIAFALQMQYAAPLNRADYKSGMHYFYAEVTGLLGQYSFSGLLVFVLAVVFICRMKSTDYKERYPKGVLPCLFSFCLLVGQSYAREGSWDCCFGGIFQIIRFLPAFAGYSILFHYLIVLFLELYRRAASSQWCPARIKSFLGEKCFRNVFLLLLILWAPVIILSYPGNLCYDFLGQIEQGLGMRGYSTHHPLLHTLIAGGVVRFGRMLTGSLDAGLFLYILLQAAALAAALAGTVSRLSRRGTSYVLRFAAVCIYVFAPMYSNIVSTAIKDVPFVAAVIWYILLLEELAAEGIESRRPLYWVKLVLVQCLTGLLRNNGIYVVVLTGLALAFVYRKRSGKGKAPVLLCTTILTLLLCAGVNAALTQGLSAERGSVGEMLSIPFQQTARYLQLYRGELPAGEREALEGVFSDVELVAGKYDPDSSDPVKALFRKDAGIRELAAYFKVWFAGFFRHPAVYLEAFFAHIYGWFDPGVSNAVRYEAETELFRQGGLIPGADKALLFAYRFAEYIPFLAILENVGMYTWLLFILGGYALRGRKKEGLLLIPLFVSLLICMASPCFYLHPRYAFPIMFTIPFLYGVIGGGTVHAGYKTEL